MMGLFIEIVGAEESVRHQQDLRRQVTDKLRTCSTRSKRNLQLQLSWFLWVLSEHTHRKALHSDPGNSSGQLAADERRATQIALECYRRQAPDQASSQP
jgi:hypothetical protein